MIKGIKKHSFAYLMMIPAIISMIIVQLIPTMQGLYISLININQYNFRKFLNAPFVGIKNYIEVLFNPDSMIRVGLLDSIKVSTIFSAILIIGTIAVGLGLAMMLNEDFRGRNLARTLLLLPWIIPTYIVGLLASFMFTQNGIINRILLNIHIISEPIVWKAGPMALISVIIITIWRFFPMTMIMYLAGLQGISKEYYEAAEIDGASAFQKFIYITWPQLKPVTAMMVLYGIIQHVYSFNIASMMFGLGSGYPGKWADLIMTNLYRNSFQLFQYGPGGAASVILMLLVMCLVALWYKIFKNSITNV